VTRRQHAHACQYLLPWIHRDAHILDVGSGSGYTAAVFHRLLQSTPASGASLSSSQSASTSTSDESSTGTQHSPPTEQGKGLVVGIDHIPSLVSWSISNLKGDGLGPALDSGEIVMVAGDGRRAEGGEGGAPYDVIHVGAAAPELPEKLVEILKSPGR
jgi:protein-L-isoaspartate(D-aspartate) O-methyltransferase